MSNESKTIVDESKDKVISFRVSPQEFDQIQRVAVLLFANKKLKSDTAGTLARAATFVQVNQFIQLEQMGAWEDKNVQK